MVKREALRRQVLRREGYGQGVDTLPEGDCYVYTFCRFPRSGLEGRGAHTSPDGRRYVGEFRDGKPNGQGVVTYLGGERCEGEFCDGMPVVR